MTANPHYPYEHHVKRAEFFLAQSEERSVLTDDESIAVAQVHATLAVAAIIELYGRNTYEQNERRRKANQGWE